MPGGCCSKGTDSDAELRARNAPTRPPPTAPPPDTSGKDAGEGGLGAKPPKPPKDFTDDAGIDAVRAPKVGPAGAGGLGDDAGNKSAGNKGADAKSGGNADGDGDNGDDDEDDDDLPMIIDAVIEEEEDEEPDGLAQWVNFCWIAFLLLAIVALVCLYLFLFLGREENGVVVVTGIVAPPIVNRTGACLSSPCQNFGACFASPERPSKYICTCRSGYSGRDCSLKDPCSAPVDPCKPTGLCLKDDEKETYTCVQRKPVQGPK